MTVTLTGGFLSISRQVRFDMESFFVCSGAPRMNRDSYVTVTKILDLLGIPNFEVPQAPSDKLSSDKQELFAGNTALRSGDQFTLA